MSAILVGVKPARFRLPHKVGGPSLPQKPLPVVSLPLSPGQKRRRLDAAYLERFFAREQRRLATGLLRPSERESVKLPSKGRVRPEVAQALGLIRNPNAAPDDPEATHWIPAAPYGRIAQSPFLPKPRAGNKTWPDLIKPLLSPLKFRRLWHAARRQGLDHLLPTGPRAVVEGFELAELRRQEMVSDSELLEMAANLKPTTATIDEQDDVMRTFAMTLPKYAHRRSKGSLFPYARMRLRRKQKRAQAIVDAMGKMPQKVQAYRESVQKSKLAGKRASPL